MDTSFVFVSFCSCPLSGAGNRFPSRETRREQDRGGGMLLFLPISGAFVWRVFLSCLFSKKGKGPPTGFLAVGLFFFFLSFCWREVWEKLTIYLSSKVSYTTAAVAGAGATIIDCLFFDRNQNISAKKWNISSAQYRCSVIRVFVIRQC